MSSQAAWRIKRQPSGTVDTGNYEVHVTDAVNRYADKIVVRMLDPDGTKSGTYARGQRIEAEYTTDGGSTWTRRLAGFVQDVVDRGPEIHFTAVGYDHLLRRTQVYDTYTSQSVSAIIEDIITNDTPVTWDANQVTLTQDPTVTREFKGERADEAINWLVSQAGQEVWGVDDDITFFIRADNATRAPQDILDGDWYDYDLPDQGMNAVNRVRVFYGEAGSRSSVIVEDRVSQRDLKDGLNTPRRVVFSHDVTYPEISNEDAAAAKGREILSDRTPTLTGTVNTFDRFEVSAGDVIALEIPEKGINDDFRVAEITYRDVLDTKVKVAENVGDVRDLLVGMSDEIDRISARDADPDATFTQFLDFTLGVTLEQSGQATQTVVSPSAISLGWEPSGTNTLGWDPGTTAPPTLGWGLAGSSSTDISEGAMTVPAIEQFRDVWQGATATEVTHYAVGTGTGAVSAADDSLGNELYREAVDSVSANGSFGVRFEGTLSPGGSVEGEEITEVGFFDASSGGNMYLRVRFDTPVVHTGDTSTEFQFDVTVGADSAQPGVVTNTGRTRLRDMWLDTTNSTNHEPTDRAYGTGTAAETGSDTSLASKVAERDIDSTADRGTGLTDVKMRIPTGEANGNTITEFGDENAANELLTRITFEGIDKSSDFALDSNLQLKIRSIPA